MGWGGVEDRGEDGGGEWAGHRGEWMSQGQRQSGELGWKQTNEFFFILSLPRTAGITLLSCQSTSPPPQPAPLLLPSSPPIFLSSHLRRTEREREKKRAGKNCLFLNRPLNLFGLGVIGHLHGEHSEVSAITTGL